MGCGDKDRPGRRAAPAPGSLILGIGPASDVRWEAIAGGIRRFGATVPHLRVELRDLPDDSVEVRTELDRAAAARPVAVCVFLPDEFSTVWQAASGEFPAVAAVRGWLDGPVARQAVVVTAGLDLGFAGTSHAGSSFPDAAELLGRNLERVAAGRRSYSLLHPGSRSTTAARGRTRFLDAVRQAHGLTLLEEREMPVDCDAARASVCELLSKYPHTGLLVTLNAEPWLSKPPEFTLGERHRIVTIGTTPELWPRLSSGEASALAGPLDGEVGYSAARLAWETLTGARPAGVREMVPPELVTRESLRDFARRYRLAAGGPPQPGE